MDEKKKVPKADLRKAYDNSWYFIAGTGSDLQEWISGYTAQLVELEIGKPIAWYVTTGKEINAFAGPSNGDPFPDDLRCLLFPLDGLAIPTLALYKLAMQDRWFDDVIANMCRMTRTEQ